METGAIDIYKLMAEKQPYSSYIKKAVGKVLIRYFDPFTEQPAEKLLVGNPFTVANKDDIIHDCWTQKEDVYFLKYNNKHLAQGLVVKYDREHEKQAAQKTKSFNTLTEEEMVALLKNKYLALLNALQKMTSTTAVNNILHKAEELEVSEKYIKAIRERLTELELGGE